MKEAQIKIEKIQCKEIYNFARRAIGQLPYQNVAPISLRRALSQANNPYSRPDDIALLVAIHKGKCVGYHGILPGLICHDGEIKRVHWTTTFFVSPNYRGKGVAGSLLKEIQKLNIDFPVTWMTQSARKAYLKAGFKELGNLIYYQLRVEKIRKLEAIFQEAQSSLESGTDQEEIKKRHSDAPRGETALYQRSKEIFYSKVVGGLKPEQNVFKHARVDQIDSQAQAIIDLQSKTPRFYRGVDALNWMLKYRWIISTEKEKAEAEPYYFSRVSELFDYVALEIYSTDKKVLRGFLILSVRAKKGKIRLKILDFAFKDPTDCELVAYFGLVYAKKFSADRLDFPAGLFDYYEQNPLIQPLIKKQQRLYLFYPRTHGSVLEACIGGIELDYCDADTAFT